MLRTIAFALGLTTLATAALAQPLYERRIVEYAPAPYAQSYAPPGYYGRAPAVCQRWCVEDDSPCDPPQFKIADARCRPKLFR